MVGKRVYNFVMLKPGEYGKVNDIWHCMPPDELNGFELVGNLAGHNVVEHEDGSITVSPSILITRHDGSWHGYLEHGVWRVC